MNWYKLANWQNKDDMLFHGTGEPIEGDISARSWGGILWMSETPDIAQNYIPETGSSTLVSLPEWRDQDLFVPNQGFNMQILKQMGYPKMNIEWDQTGQAQSWGWEDKSDRPMPRYAEIRKYVTEVLGYSSKNQTDSFEIKEFNDEFVPADFKMEGTLLIAIGKDQLQIKDLTGDSGDLMDPTYNKIGLFENAKKEGYDGVRINDYAQSEMWGNLGHVSIGLFDAGVKKLQTQNMAASNFDWSEESPEPIDTPEFSQWYQQQEDSRTET